jgi:hypothetical protein
MICGKLPLAILVVPPADTEGYNTIQLNYFVRQLTIINSIFNKLLEDFTADLVVIHLRQ